jgi:hypothetical protein
MWTLAIFDALRKMISLRHTDAAELLANANNFSINYASAILAGTPQAELVTPQTPKRLKGMTAEAATRAKRALSRLQEAISAIHDSYGQGHLHLTVVEEYLRKPIINDRVARYLKQYRPEPLIEYQARRLKARGEPDRKARGPTCVAATLVTTNSLRRERAHVHLSRRCRFIIATKSATQLRHLSSRLATRNNRARASLIERS